MRHDKQVFSKRRARLTEQSPDDLFLAFGDGGDDLDPNYAYLSGSRETAGVLLFGHRRFNLPRTRGAPGPDYMRSRHASAVLLLPKSDPVLAQWGEDASETVEGVDAAALGVDLVADVAGLDAILATALRGGRTLWLIRSAPASFRDRPDALTRLAGRIRDHFPAVRIRDAGERLDRMRALKDDGEIEAIENALQVTRRGLDRIAAATAPGIREGQLEAELSYAYRTAGASHAFGAICAAGSNALQLHYRANDGVLSEGQLLLIDTGVRLEGYCSDISRTFPVSGKFTVRQKELYDVVLEAQRVAIEGCVVGVTLADLHALAYEVIDRAGLGSRFAHGIGHHLGIHVHDTPQADGPLEAGAVITIEPGVYLEDEGIGIRIEDDVLVTVDGPRVLSADFPRSTDEIERWMAGGKD
ncbi:MAG: M24 family metallopeptidase [Acidobacteriota bacterium]|nr:M24 family metallopeptidase [Acidobacteriota bacterium]MDH3785934.1 M24 family metallopeptidase [Acidobacteriota bacterium]